MKTQTAKTTNGNGTAVITTEQPVTRHTPFPESLPGYGIVSHRPFVGRINEPVRPAKRTPGEKSGTLRLDQDGYASPLSDLKGLTPLHLNENLFAAAKAATDRLPLADMLETVRQNLHSYPDSGVKHLQEAIAAELDVTPEKIVIAPGSAALLRDIVLYLLKKGETMLVPAPSWSFYNSLVEPAEARIDTFPLLNDGYSFVYDRRLIAAKIEASRAKVVLICSPNNPTGNVLPLPDFLWLARRYPHVDFIFDEAYYGFHDSYTAVQEKELLASTDRRNVFIVRTFSKFYGLANLRLGFVVCSETDARNLQKIAPVFGLPSLDQAVAVHRLADKEFRAEMQQEFAVVNAYVYAALRQIPGLIPYQTRANFILVQHDGRWAGLENRLLPFGFKIKRETLKGDHRYFRITLAGMETMQKLMAAIQQLAG